MDIFLLTYLSNICEANIKNYFDNSKFFIIFVETLKVLIMKPLKIIYKKHIPAKNYYAITLFDTMIIRSEYRNSKISKFSINHETIHQHQSRDFGIGFAGYFIFYPLYLLEWILKLPWAIFGYNPYRSISFEQEAYEREYDLTYLSKRKRFSWIKYLFKGVKKEK